LPPMLERESISGNCVYFAHQLLDCGQDFMIRCFGLVLIATLALAHTDWPYYGNDPGAMRYSAAKQITAANVSELSLAWIFRTGKPGSEDIPIVVGGVMYVTAPDGVYALVPETGQLLWKYQTAPVALRGLAYWRGAHGLNPRVFTGNGSFLLALDATTGKPAPAFANEGRLDLKAGVLGDLKDARYALQSPSAIFNDVVITGCSNGEGSPTQGAYGDIRGWMRKPESCFGRFILCRVRVSEARTLGLRMIVPERRGFCRQQPPERDRQR
jgi:glucose dehydrogenase